MAMKNGRPNLEAEYERLHKITHYAYYTPYIIEVKHDLKAEKFARLLRWFSLFFLGSKLLPIVTRQLTVLHQAAEPVDQQHNCLEITHKIKLLKV